MTANKFSGSKRRPGIFLLPNLLTTIGLFFGFYAVVTSMSGRFEAAAVAIFIAMIFDGLDGRVARLTNTQSEFGAEYDSMADIVSFGVAPAIIAFNWALKDMGKIGWLAAFIFVAGGALRLARFNTQVGIADKRYFQGLAIPAAAGVLAAMVWVGAEYQVEGADVSYLVCFVTIAMGLLMVSNFRYSSFKDVDWQSKVSFVVVLVFVMMFVVIASSPAEMLLLIFAGYALSGPITTIRSVRRLKFGHIVGDDDADFDETSETSAQTKKQQSSEQSTEQSMQSDNNDGSDIEQDSTDQTK